MTEHSGFIGSDEKIHNVRTTPRLQRLRVQHGIDGLTEARRNLYKAKLDERGRSPLFTKLVKALDCVDQALGELEGEGDSE